MRLNSVGLKAEIGGFILSAQDQYLLARNYQYHLVKIYVDSNYRPCDKYPETIHHLVSGWTVLAPTEY